MCSSDLSDSAARIDVTVADLRTLRQQGSHVVVANLTGALLAATARTLESFLTADGCLVLSGFLEPEIDAVLAAFRNGHRARLTRLDGWVCAVIGESRSPDGPI